MNIFNANLRLHFTPPPIKQGKKLAQRLKGRRIKAKINHLTHPLTKTRLTNPQDIANAFSDYYSDLYNIRNDPSTFHPTNEDIHAFLQQITLPTLTETQLQQLNEPFSDLEILTTIQSLPLGKALGPDGMRGEYYKTYATQLIPHLNQLFNSAASSSSFPRESLTARIITLP